MNPIIIIPARMGSTRLPGKPLALIHGRPMVVHVMERAREAGRPAGGASDAGRADAASGTASRERRAQP